MYEKLWSLRKQLQHSHNLIHCITNPISMNDCANAVLALGAKPIMAQHPMECEHSLHFCPGTVLAHTPAPRS